MFEDFHNRLKKMFRQRKSWASRLKTTAFRVYEKDIPEYPYAVDLYGDYVVIYDLSIEDSASEDLGKRPRDKIIMVVSEALSTPTKNIIFKRRKRMKGADQYEKFSERKLIISVQEGPAILEVDLTSYLDTGLFLDHRPLRQIIHRQAHGKSFLNLFSYTGSISVMAALGGARCTSVDLSNTYQEWCKRNFALNKIDQKAHQFIVGDVWDFLIQTKEKFDLIVLDPPTFSNSKKTPNVLDIQRDHARYIQSCGNLLSRLGSLYFSTNARKFKLDTEVKENFLVKDISSQSIPDDFRDKKVHHAWLINHRI